MCVMVALLFKCFFENSCYACKNAVTKIAKVRKIVFLISAASVRGAP
jgi:hypothetical protein